MGRLRITPSLVLSMLALFIALGGTTYAATGGTFILGQANTASTQTSLTANPASGAALKITNSGAGPAASFQVPAGQAPFQVNSTTKVKSLNADLLDGLNSSAFLPATGTAVNSQELDGLSALQFIQGSGTATGAAYAVGPTGADGPFTFGPGWQVSYLCPAAQATPGTLTISSPAGIGTNLFVQPSVGTVYQTIAPAASVSFPGTPSGQVWVFRMQTNSYVATLQVATVNRVSDCHFQAQALVTTY
jgi:hypothetical protein